MRKTGHRCPPWCHYCPLTGWKHPQCYDAAFFGPGRCTCRRPMVEDNTTVDKAWQSLNRRVSELERRVSTRGQP